MPSGKILGSITKKWWRWLLVTLGVLVATVAMLPTVLGSRWLYQPLIDQMAADNFDLKIDSVRLRWLWPLQMDGLRLSQANGPVLLSVQSVQTDRGLLGYLLGGRKLGKLTIIQPTVSVELLQDSSNLARVIESVKKSTNTGKNRSKTPPPVDIEVIIQQLSAKVQSAESQQPLVVVPPFDVRIQYSASERIDRTAQKDNQSIDRPTRSPASSDSNAMVRIWPTKVLDHVKVTKELVDLGLGHAIPLLAKSAWFDGSVSLSIDEIRIDLEKPEDSSGKLQLTLHQLRSGPADPTINRALDLASGMLKREIAHELIFVDGSVVNLELAQQRLKHDGLEFGLPRLDQRFQMATSGWVGLKDDSLDVQIEVPVPVEQLARRQQVKELGVPKLRLPLTGTLDNPQLNWDALRGDTSQLLSAMRTALGDDAPATASVLGALEGLADGKADESIATAMDLIHQFRQRQKSARQAANKEVNGSQKANDAPNADNPKATDSDTNENGQGRNLRESIRDLLRRRKESP